MREWEYEPDAKKWTSMAGLRCVLKRNNFGAWCGYVDLPPDHSLFGSDYNDIDGISVHGGLTFSGTSPDNHWRLGFDCSHSGDLCPELSITHNGTYRSIKFAEAETESLAAQLKEVG